MRIRWTEPAAGSGETEAECDSLQRERGRKESRRMMPEPSRMVTS